MKRKINSGALPCGDNPKSMPSVGMRRSTRVFGARVLRSGRRLSTARYDGSKHIRAARGEDKWTELLEVSVNGGGDAGDLYKGMWKENDIDPVETKVRGEVDMKKDNRTCTIVYKRKRKRVELKEDKRFGKKYARKQWRKKCLSSAPEISQECHRPLSGFALVVNRPDYECAYWIMCLMISILSYMTEVRIGLKQLSAFLLSKPLCDVYSSRGILFIQDSSIAMNFVTCRISGSRASLPLFSINFPAVPSLFVYMQTSMYFRFANLGYLFVAHSLDVHEKNEITSIDDEELSFESSQWNGHGDCIPVSPQGSYGIEMTCTDVVATGSDNSQKKEVPLSQSAAALSKSSFRNIQIRNSRKIQKRRSSLRRKRGRPPSAFRALKSGGGLHSDVLRVKQDGLQPAQSVPGLRSSYKSSPSNFNELKSAFGVLSHNGCATHCSANLLVTETDKCYREEGATVTLELSASNQWLIAVMKDGTKRYNLVAHKAMRQSWNNRFTHATIWMVDSGWKLEFLNRRDWLIFKELYKECYDRNLLTPSFSVIPVPGVFEVSSTIDTEFVPFVRPASYITIKDDELTRALKKKSANYDMDSDDEAWLLKLNEELFAGREWEELVKPDGFELVIDGIEKAIHCNPDEHLHGQAVYDSCVHLERREVIEAIHNYWMRKRKQNHSSLARIFQLYQPRRSQVIIPKPIFRKKRSFKRATSQVGRGKQRPSLQAIVAGHEVSDEQNLHKLQEAKAAAERSEDLAIQKRQRAQMLMENADLATYKALMALRIAETGQIPQNLETVASFLLG